MDVWPRCLCFGLVRGSRTARYANTLPVGRTPSAKSRGISASPDCYLSWMSGPAAYALVLLEDRGQLVTQTLYPSGEHLPPSQGESPLPLTVTYHGCQAPLLMLWSC